MTKHGPRRQLKRIAAPKLFPIPRKIKRRFVIKPMPGPHPAERSIPLGIIIRDILGYARTLKEVRKIVHAGYVKIDGRVVKDYRFPVGLMDVIELTLTDEIYRVLPFKRRLVLHKITPEEAKFKIARIVGKRYVKKGHIQLNLEGGRNILLKVNNEEERREILQKYSVGDSLMISIPNQEILKHFKLAENKYAIIIAGRHMGVHGQIKEINRMYGPRASTVTIVTPNEEEFITALEYTLLIGDERPAITLPTEEEYKKVIKRFE